MRKTASLVAFAALTALTAGTALADLSATDRHFVTEAAVGGLAEVELGQLALQKATSQPVKQFAQQMVTDHTQANQELMQIAKQQNLTVPTQLDAKRKADMDRLRALSGSAFDTAYAQHMVQDHQQDIAEFQKQVQSGSDPMLKSFAQKQLPVLQKHLQLAQAIAPKS